MKNLVFILFLGIFFLGCTGNNGYNLKPTYYSDVKTLYLFDLEFYEVVRDKHIINNLDYGGRTGKVYSRIEQFRTKDKACKTIYSQQNRAKDGFEFKVDFEGILNKKYKGKNCITEKVSNLEFVWCANDKKNEYRIISSVKDEESFTRATSLRVGLGCFNKLKKYIKEKEKAKK